MQKWLNHLCLAQTCTRQLNLLVLRFCVALKKKIPLVRQMNFMSYWQCFCYLNFFEKFPKNFTYLSCKWWRESTSTNTSSFFACWCFKQMLLKFQKLDHTINSKWALKEWKLPLFVWKEISITQRFNCSFNCRVMHSWNMKHSRKQRRQWKHWMDQTFLNKKYLLTGHLWEDHGKLLGT